MSYSKDIRQQGCFVTLAVLLLLLTFGAAVAAYDDGIPVYISIAHAHGGGMVQSHVDIEYRAEHQVSFIPAIGEDRSALFTEYVFVLPDSPIFLLDPPPEAA